jgi:hypothetical protein
LEYIYTNPTHTRYNGWIQRNIIRKLEPLTSFYQRNALPKSLEEPLSLGTLELAGAQTISCTKLTNYFEFSMFLRNHFYPRFKCFMFIFGSHVFQRVATFIRHYSESFRSSFTNHSEWTLNLKSSRHLNSGNLSLNTQITIMVKGFLTAVKIINGTFNMAIF